MSSTPKNILQDNFGRDHAYLRISLIERCNLRCSYCMPEEGVPLSPKSHLMTYEEIYEIAKTFVKHGVSKIRLTGGEPLVRKDFPVVLEKLASLPVELSITSNAVIIDKFIEVLKTNNVKSLNISLDSLNRDKFKEITRRDNFEKVYNNILLLVKEGFKVKLNVVLMKDFNDNEVIDFINFTKTLPITVRFIEFMPFDGNKWDMSKMVSYSDIMNIVYDSFDETQVERLKDAPNDTSKNYRIKGYTGSFAIISSVTNPFCDSCNRLRLTANGQLKNCLFSATESDILGNLRAGNSIEPIIEKAVKAKFKVRGGMNTLEKLQEPERHNKNRSMITIGG
ncbi:MULTISPECIES: GTP 3',8-cyclase MoaA [Aestuariibaculum]|uniref:GTP 3',8-cyclase n=1 Tax=Aestuariibaculum lutulentum TaxID=2920935 RepID=A0ABS9RIZ9_9FLAO|nr:MULTISPECIES: GTP 3',8-cyclase MoaA [Aestuariibaculum]MCH4552862.1 GTP 3',8-cyclase MoaA [Aestuariibaculum lutulentum]MCR8669248.1 GTP 3',8-cyclase MoaA [Aestuariibaculum sp. M13]